MLDLKEAPSGMAGFHRSRKNGPFSSRERLFLDGLVPHLSRSLRFRNLLAQSAECQWGVLDLDKNGSISGGNKKAVQVAAALDSECLPDNSLIREMNAAGTVKEAYRVIPVPARLGSGERKQVLTPVLDSKEMISAMDGFGLTKRQEEVTVLVIRGLSNREIADRLYIELQTVKDHLKSIYQKTGVRRRTGLAAKLLNLLI